MLKDPQTQVDASEISKLEQLTQDLMCSQDDTERKRIITKMSLIREKIFQRMKE